jgi:hypothetical protein
MHSVMSRPGKYTPPLSKCTCRYIVRLLGEDLAAQNSKTILGPGKCMFASLVMSNATGGHVGGW